MARYAPLTLDTAAAIPATTARSTTAAPKRGLLERVLAALVQARMRQAERHIAHYLASTGSKLTDSVEREVERRLTGGRPTLL